MDNPATSSLHHRYHHRRQHRHQHHIHPNHRRKIHARGAGGVGQPDVAVFMDGQCFMFTASEELSLLLFLITLYHV